MNGRELTLSRNELTALLKRVFEGIFNRSCDFEALAHQIVWLERHGLGGMDLLRGCVDHLADHDTASVEMEPTPDGDDVEIICVDAQGSSLLCIADMIADLTISRCAAHGACHIEVTNVHEREAILPQLCRIRNSGFYVGTQSSEDNGDAISFARIVGDTALPELFGWNPSAQGRASGTLSLVAASSKAGLISGLGNRWKEWPAPEITPAILDDRYQTNLNNGIVVGDLSYLNKIAERVLVEASDASRQGAGE